jgi:hypothetical protein
MRTEGSEVGSGNDLNSEVGMRKWEKKKGRRWKKKKVGR